MGRSELQLSAYATERIHILRDTRHIPHLLSHRGNSLLNLFYIPGGGSMERDAFVMMKGQLMTPLPSPPLLIKVRCSQNYIPLLRSPSCRLIVIRHTVCIFLLNLQLRCSDSFCPAAPTVQGLLPPWPPWLWGPFLSGQMGGLCRGGGVMASEIQTGPRLGRRGGGWWPLGCPWLTFSSA